MSAEPLLTDLDRQTIAVSKALAADAVEQVATVGFDDAQQRLHAPR